MLFKFGKFWKNLLFVIGSWIFYGIWGADLTIVTLLALFIAMRFDETEKFI